MRKRVALLMMCGGAAAYAAAPAAASEAAGTIDWLAEILKGGHVSIVLLFTGFAGLVVFLERAMVVRTRYFVPAPLAKALAEAARRSDFTEMESLCDSPASTLGVLGQYLSRHAHLPFEYIALGTSDMIGRMVGRQQQRTYPLAVVATVSPLLGLLGTIIGMIEAFQKVALMGDTGDASVLADSIGKALITTALGLIIAIPSLTAYHFYKSRLHSFGLALEEAADQLMVPWLHPEASKEPPE